MEIIHSIQQLADLTESDISGFAKVASVRNYKPNSNFIRGGQTPTEFGFVLSGLFRYVYLSETGKELTKVFMPEKRVL